MGRVDDEFPFIEDYDDGAPIGIGQLLLVFLSMLVSEKHV